MYVADSRHSRIMGLPLDNPSARTAETVIQMDHGKPDGFAFDVDGNLVVASPNLDGPPGDVQVFDKNWQLIEVLKPGNSQLYTNLAISTERRLYLCDADHGNVLSTPWPCAGLPLHPFRNKTDQPNNPATGNAAA